MRSTCLRRYIADNRKTLHRVFLEIRVFLAYDESEARSLIPLLMDDVRKTILRNEWYALMPRWEQAKKKINQQFGI